MEKSLRNKLPLMEVREITWAEALRLMAKPEMELEPVASAKNPVSLPYGEQAITPIHVWR